VRPTPAGTVLYPLAREALAVLERAELSVRSPETAPALRIHASRTIGETLLPDWLASFRAAGPQCRVSVAVTNSEEVVHAVRDGDAEVGFVETTPGSMHGLRELVVAHDELRAVVAKDHPWARRPVVTVDELTREPFLAREAGSGTRAVVAAALAELGIELQPTLELSSAEGLKHAVLGGGFALLSERAVEAEIAVGVLAAIPVSGVDLQRTLRAVRRTRPVLQGPARAFWRWLDRTVAPRAVGATDT
jgi:DNA-binding transcriptional LysR family regulator